REDIEDKSRDLPGFQPSARKKGRSYYTDAMVTRARRNIDQYASCRQQAAKATKYDAMTDEQLWQSLLPWSIPRQLYGNWPCPFCGEKIYAHNAFYPWEAADTFHSRCP